MSKYLNFSIANSNLPILKIERDLQGKDLFKMLVQEGDKKTSVLYYGDLRIDLDDVISDIVPADQQYVIFRTMPGK